MESVDPAKWNYKKFNPIVRDVDDKQTIAPAA